MIIAGVKSKDFDHPVKSCEDNTLTILELSDWCDCADGPSELHKTLFGDKIIDQNEIGLLVVISLLHSIVPTGHIQVEFLMIFHVNFVADYGLINWVVCWNSKHKP